MNSSFSDKPFSGPPPRREFEESVPSTEDLRQSPQQTSPWPGRGPRTRLNLRRLLTGFSILFLLAGVLLLCFIPGGFLNQRWQPFTGEHFVTLNEPGHVVGFICLGLGAVGFVFLFSLERRD